MGTYNNHWEKSHHFSYTFNKKKQQQHLGKISSFKLTQFAKNLVWTIPLYLFLKSKVNYY